MSHHDEIKIDQTAVGNASAKLNLLADLFTGAGFGAQLDLNEHSLFGLVLILQECAATMDTVERAVGARNIARATAERRVN